MWEAVSPEEGSGGDTTGSSGAGCTGSGLAGPWGKTGKGSLPGFEADSDCSCRITDSMSGVISGAVGCEGGTVGYESPPLIDCMILSIFVSELFAMFDHSSQYCAGIPGILAAVS